MAINYFTCQGYTISLPINDTQWYDLVVEKDGKFYTVQCKATQTENGDIDFRSTGGTNGGVYDNPNVTIREALADIVNDLKMEPDYNGAKGNIRVDDELIPIDYDGLMEKVEEANQIVAED